MGGASDRQSDRGHRPAEPRVAAAAQRLFQQQRRRLPRIATRPAPNGRGSKPGRSRSTAAGGSIRAVRASTRTSSSAICSECAATSASGSSSRAWPRRTRASSSHGRASLSPARGGGDESGIAPRQTLGGGLRACGPFELLREFAARRREGAHGRHEGVAAGEGGALPMSLRGLAGSLNSPASPAVRRRRRAPQRDGNRTRRRRASKHTRRRRCNRHRRGSAPSQARRGRD